MRSAIYEGVVGHRRHSHDLTDHVANEFSQRLVLPLIYLDEVDEVMSLHPLWSAKRPNAAWMRRGDYLGDPDISLEVAARDEVEGALGRRPTGAIAMLGHLRTWGKISNPLCLFYCFDEETGGLEAIVAHVTNTPWGERHSYVMDGRSSCARLPKVMHVSPLLGMDHDYHFDWSEPGATLNFGIEVRHGESRFFDASLRLERRDMNHREMGRLLWRHGLDNHAVTAGIYFRALALRMRGANFHPHPRTHSNIVSSTAIGVTHD